MESRGGDEWAGLRGAIARGADTIKAGAIVGSSEAVGTRFAGLLRLIEEGLESRGGSMERIFQLRVEELSEMLAQGRPKQGMFIKEVFHHLSSKPSLKIF